ncbi:MAG: AAA family ATPase [Legionellales bacterium]|nr:MAG: AAA family ATPase [Legionellales bacterium]
MKISGVRSFLWPIYGAEHKKLVPMFALFFMITMIYNLVRSIKVSVLITAPGSGAEAIPFIKFWLVLPAAFLVTYIFTKVANRFTREKVFYAVVLSFLVFFMFFVLVLFPNREFLALDSFAILLQKLLPAGAKGFIAIIRHWSLSLFYVVAEFWSTLVVAMLFWGFANEVTKVSEAKRFYAIFALGANSSGIFAGQLAQIVTVKTFNPLIPFGTTAWEQTLFLQFLIITMLGAIVIAIFYWLNSKVFHEEAASDVLSMSGDSNRIKVKKPKLSLRECFVYLARSHYMRYIAVIVVAYNIIYNVADTLWMAHVRATFSEPGVLNAYINQVVSITGIFAAVFALVLAGNVIRKFGWIAAALITPVVWVVFGVGFYGCMLLDITSIAGVAVTFMGNPVNMIVLLASAQMCFGRACKYTLFDETKEIAFIPLPKENQRKGKAVVDGIGSRLGKSGGAIMIQILLLLCSDIMLTVPYLVVILVLISIAWIYSVLKLGKLVKQQIDNENQEEVVVA